MASCGGGIGSPPWRCPGGPVAGDAGGAASDESDQNALKAIGVVIRRHGAGCVAALLLVLAGCSSQTTSPRSQASGPARSADWQGTDLLWDALGTRAGFTAVGNSGVVVTSSNGVNWTEQPVATGQTLRGISSNGTTTLAVGTGGAVVSWPSGDPGRPTVHPTGTARTLMGAAYHAGTWVVGGSGGTVLTSTGLSRWTRRASGTAGDIFAVAYGAGRFVGVADDGSIVTSLDGTSWTEAVKPDGVWLWDVVFGGGTFVATGAGGTVLQSADGLRWTKRPSGTKQVLRGVT